MSNCWVCYASPLRVGARQDARLGVGPGLTRPLAALAPPDIGCGSKPPIDEGVDDCHCLGCWAGGAAEFLCRRDESVLMSEGETSR